MVNRGNSRRGEGKDGPPLPKKGEHIQSVKRSIIRSCRACGLKEVVPTPPREDAGKPPNAGSGVRERAKNSPMPLAQTIDRPSDQVTKENSLLESSMATSSSATPNDQEPTAGVSPISPALALATSKTKSRSKKKHGLQELLARNREQERQRKDTTGATTNNLAGFLTSLN